MINRKAQYIAGETVAEIPAAEKVQAEAPKLLINFELTAAQNLFLQCDERGALFIGGIGSSKTYGLATWAIIRAMQGRRVCLVSFSYRTLIDVIQRTINEILIRIQLNYNKDYAFVAGENKFVIFAGEIMLRSGDNPESLRGLNLDDFGIDEGSNFKDDELFKILLGRIRNSENGQWRIATTPKGRNWIYTLSQQYKTFGQSTFDNPFLPQTYLDEVSHYYKGIYARQELYGEFVAFTEGRIMPPFSEIDTMPAIPTTIGIDFGFRDATAILESGIQGDSLFINELLYKTNLTNLEIANHLKRLKVPLDYIIYCDNAEPKSIEELKREGFRGVRPCLKGKDFFAFGIQFIRRYKIFVTKSSKACITDFTFAEWEMANDNETFLNVAKQGHLHAIDALRYSLSAVIKPSAGFLAHMTTN